MLCRCGSNNVCRTLDYIFVSSELRVADAFVLPQVETDTVHAECYAKSIVNGISKISIDGHDECSATYEQFRSVIVTSSQPSATWPSDHFIVSATVCL
jgi:endonuclease/exonuclease/phosphatase family metal-dependent hydrolase